MRVAMFGTYVDLPGYPRTDILRQGLRAWGVEVIDVHEPVWDRPVREMMAGSWGVIATKAMRVGVGAARAGRRLSALASRLDAVLVGYPGLVDVHVARRVVCPRIPVVLDAFIPIARTIAEYQHTGDDRLRIGAAWRLERAAYSAANLILVDGEPHARLLSQDFGVGRQKIVVAQPGCALPGQTSPHAPAPGPPYVITYVGHLLPHHGIDVALSAAQCLDERFVFHFWGSGPVRALTKTQGAWGARVVLHPEGLAESRSVDVLRAGHIALGILATGGKADRVIPFKVYLALAAGVPVITSDSPMARALLTHGRNAWLVEPASAEALASGIRTLAENPSLAQRIGWDPLESTCRHASLSIL